MHLREGLRELVGGIVLGRRGIVIQAAGAIAERGQERQFPEQRVHLLGALLPVVGAGFDRHLHDHGIRGRLLHLLLHEAAFEGAVQHLRGQMIGQLLEMDQVDGVGQQIARMAAAEYLAGLTVTLLNEGVEQRAFERKILGGAGVFEDTDEFVERRAAEQHLVLNAPEERLVAEVLRDCRLVENTRKASNGAVILPPS